jgi:hypothetical protein
MVTLYEAQGRPYMPDRLSHCRVGTGKKRHKGSLEAALGQLS